MLMIQADERHAALPGSSRQAWFKIRNDEIRLFVFDFCLSDSGRDISHDISQRMWPSLAIARPVLLIGLQTVVLSGTFRLMVWRASQS